MAGVDSFYIEQITARMSFHLSGLQSDDAFNEHDCVCACVLRGGVGLGRVGEGGRERLKKGVCEKEREE